MALKLYKYQEKVIVTGKPKPLPCGQLTVADSGNSNPLFSGPRVSLFIWRQGIRGQEKAGNPRLFLPTIHFSPNSD